MVPFTKAVDYLGLLADNHTDWLIL